MKYKVFKSVAHNWGHSFTSDSNIVGEDFAMSYLARAALKAGEDEFRINILTGSAEPPSLLTPPIKRSVDAYVGAFPQMATSQGVSMSVVRSADAILRFDLTRKYPRRGSIETGQGSIETINVPFEMVVRIVDDRGQEHVGRVLDEWPASREPLFRRRRKWWQFW